MAQLDSPPAVRLPLPPATVDPHPLRAADTLVHEDFHPGSVRNLPDGGYPPVILDWGDAFIGPPGFDALRMVDDLDAAQARPLLEAWQPHWKASLPGSDPATALSLLRPVAALLHAVVYANFLANIEPSERPTTLPMYPTA